MKNLTMVKTLLSHAETEQPPAKIVGVFSLVSSLLWILMGCLYLKGNVLLFSLFAVMSLVMIVLQIYAAFWNIKNETRYRLYIAMGVVMVISQIPWIISEVMQLDPLNFSSHSLALLYAVEAPIVLCYRWKWKILGDEISSVEELKKRLNREQKHHQRPLVYIIFIALQIVLIVLAIVLPDWSWIKWEVFWWEIDIIIMWNCTWSWLKLYVKKYVEAYEMSSDGGDSCPPENPYCEDCEKS